MKRSREAWFAMVAAALGVASCRHDATDAPVAHDTPQASASASAAPSATPTADPTPTPEVASATEVPSAAPSAPLGLGTIGHGSCGGSSNNCGVGRPKVEGPRANVAATVVGAANPGDARILAMMRAGLRACANKALQQDPTQSGSLQLSVSIGADGAVTRVLSTKNSGLSADCAACMQRRVGNAQFPATGAARTITVTIAQTIATS